MKNKFKEIFISAIVISSVSLIAFIIFISLYNNKRQGENPVQPNITASESMLDDSILNEIEYLKKKTLDIQLNDTIQNVPNEKEKLNDEIITYVSYVQKHIYSNKEKDIKVLKSYYSKLKEYYKIPGLSVNANRLLLGTIRSLRIEINNIENISNQTSQKNIPKITIETDTVINNRNIANTIQLVNKNDKAPISEIKYVTTDSINASKNDSIN